MYRNPNIIENNGNGTTRGSSQAELFRHTSAALAADEVVGVFPEGTSYTEPAIARVKDGAAWAAVEYAKAANLFAPVNPREGRKEFLIVPAAVVYTDKSQYQSRVCLPVARLERAGIHLSSMSRYMSGKSPD